MEIIETTFQRRNLLRAGAGTTGMPPACGASQAYTLIELEDLGNSQLDFKVFQDRFTGRKELMIEAKGNDELATVLDALSFIVETLRDQIAEQQSLGEFGNESIFECAEATRIESALS